MFVHPYSHKLPPYDDLTSYFSLLPKDLVLLISGYLRPLDAGISASSILHDFKDSQISALTSCKNTIIVLARNSTIDTLYILNTDGVIKNIIKLSINTEFAYNFEQLPDGRYVIYGGIGEQYGIWIVTEDSARIVYPDNIYAVKNFVVDSTGLIYILTELTIMVINDQGNILDCIEIAGIFYQDLLIDNADNVYIISGKEIGTRIYCLSKTIDTYKLECVHKLNQNDISEYSLFAIDNPTNRIFHFTTYNRQCKIEYLPLSAQKERAINIRMNEYEGETKNFENATEDSFTYQIDLSTILYYITITQDGKIIAATEDNKLLLLE